MRRKDQVKMWVLMAELSFQALACGVWTVAVLFPDLLGEVPAQLAEAAVGFVLYAVLLLLLLIFSRNSSRRKKGKRLSEEYLRMPPPSERAFGDEVTRLYIQLHSINGVAVVALLCLAFVAIFAMYSIG